MPDGMIVRHFHSRSIFRKNVPAPGAALQTLLTPKTAVRKALRSKMLNGSWRE